MISQANCIFMSINYRAFCILQLSGKLGTSESESLIGNGCPICCDPWEGYLVFVTLQKIKLNSLNRLVVKHL